MWASQRRCGECSLGRESGGVAMIARYNNISLALGIPGLILQFVGLAISNANPENQVVGMVITVTGVAMLTLGLAMYAKAKGRSPLWCVMGLFSLLGLIVLALLKDYAPEKPKMPSRW